ncbi:hypothetical protein [Pseudoduganella buxea]|uniref:Uncharacterized protein n=1 Tax=Pseudoduganella buxea TaxID=1949069 RepID=A0A6I3SVE1_9BURK|nr:hypothetical protein [Pseudoduganella buxea]MTV51767.1 hypothetical protein [Pseudoduganella buxea]
MIRRNGAGGDGCAGRATHAPKKVTVTRQGLGILAGKDARNGQEKRPKNGAKKKPAEAGQEILSDQRLTEVSSALLGLLGDVPGVPVVDGVVDGVVASMLLPVVPVAGVLAPDVALAPEVALSLLPLVVSVVLQAARATQNAAAKIVFTIAMMFSFYKRVKTIELEGGIVVERPARRRAVEF